MSSSDRSTFRHQIASLRRSVQAAVGVNSSAFGFSIVITAALAATAHAHGNPDGWELLLFGLGGVTSFTCLDLLATEGFRRSVARERPEIVTHAASLSFLSVSVAIAAAVGVAELVGGIVVWPLASFVAATLFILVVGLELTLAEAVDDER